MPLKFAFFGTPDVAARTLAALLEKGLAPALVITNPDALKGRGMTLAPSPVKSLALSHGLQVITPEALDESVLAGLKQYECDLAVVVAYGKIFPQAFIDAFPEGVVNVHYSLLPKYRGATPLEAALLSGDTETGVTIQRMAREVDAGDVLAQESTPIAPDETARELRPRLIEMGARLLVAILPAYAKGEIAAEPQDSMLATRARKFSKEDGLLDLAGDARENWNKYRAYADSIGTYFRLEDKRVKITRASFADGIFIIESIIPEGKREMSYSDFARR